MRTGNLFADLPAALSTEVTEVLARADGARVERILSAGHRSPPGFWYDQHQDEWVVVLRGRAVLRLENAAEPLSLGPGDWVHIPARARHRVEWTDPDQPTVWLGVFLGGSA